ncbi:hypothetical protein HYPBUDRAFT_7146 [Hyphopichia burtonii NRRL Y-1933]|uniref:Uncharacterized protein n=1 Tax=Hyphopichia burtonii NRRL Y-1933 TaxID=984485 RepID=A0A1E4REV3_9ASCO|nr:hypothetical protein HYPBUDRAFT_7146 [Hyphopichia burtonii NRRL Y-1933]ODV65798.1 hypothetical protein HYPBUDRAFT_7146 [Hyphopichia burtonii NRRL Y-1933]
MINKFRCSVIKNAYSRDKYDSIREGLNDNMCAFIEMNGMTISEEDGDWQAHKGIKLLRFRHESDTSVPELKPIEALDGYDERVDHLSEILELWAKINEDLNNNQSDTIT